MRPAKPSNQRKEKPDKKRSQRKRKQRGKRKEERGKRKEERGREKVAGADVKCRLIETLMTAVTVSGCPLETLGGMATTLYHQYTEGISLVLPVFLGFYLFLVGSLGSFNPSLYLASFSVSVSVSLSDPAVGDVGPALSTHRVLIAVLTSSTPWL